MDKQGGNSSANLDEEMKQLQTKALPELLLHYRQIMRHTANSHETKLRRIPAADGRDRLASIGVQCLLALLLLTKAAAAASLAITTQTLSNAIVGTAYSQTLDATGGTPPYTWAIQSGGLPSLLTLNPTNGQITGMPTASGSWVFSYPFQAYIVVTDAASNTAAASFDLTVVPAPNTYYTLTVSNGSGGGFYLTNTTVSITANAAPAGEVFQNWTGAMVVNPLSATTSIVMPGSNVTVTAVYGTGPPTYYYSVKC